MLGKLIVDYNPSIKQEINLEKSNNQKFLQIPLNLSMLLILLVEHLTEKTRH